VIDGVLILKLKSVIIKPIWGALPKFLSWPTTLELLGEAVKTKFLHSGAFLTSSLHIGITLCRIS
jgi:hypothetical protein